MIGVQDLINHRHKQEQTHAMLVPAPAIVLQLGRFHYEANKSQAIKRRFKVGSERRVRAPCFREALDS